METRLPHLFLLLVVLFSCQRLAGATEPLPPNAETTAADKTTPPAQSSDDLRALDSLKRLLEQQEAKTTELKALTRKLRDKQDEASQADELRSQIQQLEEQISAISTGQNSANFDLTEQQNVDFEQEFQQLLLPFVLMLRSATDHARHIEDLRRIESMAKRHRATAVAALENLAPLLEIAKDPTVKAELKRTDAAWRERLKNAESLVESTQRQLRQRQDQQNKPNLDAGTSLSSFVISRGANLLLGVLAFGLVLGVMYGFRVLVSRITKRLARGPRSMPVRVLSLLYAATCVICAASAMLVVFNLRNDWILLGLSTLLLLTMSWFAVRSMANILDQIALYLNLGAVQEKERLVFNGVPWMVDKLGFHCHLVNPSLEGGRFSMPIRELIGLHSRPVVDDEPWFPTEKQDWVLTDDGLAQVISQSPGIVILRRVGGIEESIPAADFFANAPANISHGSRAEIVFSVAYKHQDIATGELRRKLVAFVRQGLEQILRPAQIVNVAADVLAASDSSIDYEVEADLTGDAAPLYEDVERAIAALCIDACQHYGWEIPFPQLVLHQPSS